MSKIKLICTSCPRGCHLQVDENLNVTGNHCPRGIAYARDEITNPRRYIA
ncbi:MAG: molybdopterin oxidoreductase, partial [Bacilli bacterium]